MYILNLCFIHFILGLILVPIAIDILPIRQTYFIADHPFILILQESSNNNILFLGRVLSPSLN